MAGGGSIFNFRSSEKRKGSVGRKRNRRRILSSSCFQFIERIENHREYRGSERLRSTGDEKTIGIDRQK